jgi:hypothetical protein
MTLLGGWLWIIGRNVLCPVSGKIRFYVPLPPRSLRVGPLKFCGKLSLGNRVQGMRGQPDLY